MADKEMSNMCFSPSNLGFYPAAWQHDGTYTEETWPSDAVLLTAEEFSTYYGASPPAGKMLGVSEGRPAWADYVAPDRPEDELAAEARTNRDLLLTNVYDRGVSMIMRGLRMTSDPAQVAYLNGKLAELDAYAIYLQNMPEQPGFPSAIIWPTQPTE